MTGHFIHGQLTTGGLSVEEFEHWLTGLTALQRAWVDNWGRARFYDVKVIYTDPRYMMSRRAIRDTMEASWTRKTAG